MHRKNISLKLYWTSIKLRLLKVSFFPQWIFSQPKIPHFWSRVRMGPKNSSCILKCFAFYWTLLTAELSSCHQWSHLLEDRILVAEHFVIWLLKWSCDQKHSTLTLIGLDGQSERPNLINLLVMLSTSTYDCPNHILWVVLLTNKYLTLFYLKDAWRWWRLQFSCADRAIFETI